MRWSDRFRFVRQNMAKNKSRVFMTVLAAAMGCSFLMMLASVAFGLQSSLIRDITGGRALTDMTIYGRIEGKESRQLNASDVELLRRTPKVRAVTVRTRLPSGSIALPGGYKLETSPMLADFTGEKHAGLELSEGRLPADGREIVVGYHFGELLVDESGGPYTGEVVGSTVTVELPDPYVPMTSDGAQRAEPARHKAELTIVGVLQKPDREVVKDGSVLLPDSLYGVFSPAAVEAGVPLRPNDVHVFAEDASHLTKLSETFRSKGFQLYSPADSIKEMDIVFLILKIGLIFVGTIAVLIASIGIYNTMTMAVTERAQDIGIMKAIGAHPRIIRSIFLLESAGIGLAGALIGAAAAYGLSGLVNAVLPPILSGALDADVPDGFRFSSIPPALTLISASISLLVAVLSGVRPAARATRIDVLSALRRDI